MENKQQAEKLDENEFKVYDRQLRVWGVQAQKKMKESKVLVLNLSSVVTELCRHLVLSGINLELVDANAETQVEYHHVESDFLFTEADIGQSRAGVVRAKLSEMNPFAKVESDCTYSVQKIIDNKQFKAQKYSAVIYGFRTFNEAIQINDLCRQSDTPFYCLNSSGLFGFFFADLGKEMQFTHLNKATQLEDLHSITESKTMASYLHEFTDVKQKLNWNKRQLFKNTKYLLLSIIMKYQQEQENETKMQDENCSGGVWDKMCKFIKIKGLPDALQDNEEFKMVFQRFDQCFNLEFNPSSSVIGAIVSQEIVKVITQKDFPGHGFCVYDSITQKCSFE